MDEPTLKKIDQALNRESATMVSLSGQKRFVIVPAEVWESDDFWEDGYHYGIGQEWKA